MAATHTEGLVPTLIRIVRISEAYGRINQIRATKAPAHLKRKAIEEVHESVRDIVEVSDEGEAKCTKAKAPH